jgi:hypothetical protein
MAGEEGLNHLIFYKNYPINVANYPIFHSEAVVIVFAIQKRGSPQ